MKSAQRTLSNVCTQIEHEPSSFYPAKPRNPKELEITISEIHQIVTRTIPF